MKKFFVIALALFIALPALSYAGSVTSRWDVTIGGYIKFDVGYMSQGQGVDYRTAYRSSAPGRENIVDEYGNVNWYGGESRLNFAIKGPDTWGAKTSAFLEGDFRGVAGSNVTNFAGTPGLRGDTGYFTLRHAFMDFKWAKTTLLLGHTWQPWGLMPSFQILAFSENHFMKGATRVPQARLTYAWTKEFSTQVAIASPNQTLWGNQGANYVDDQNRSLVPDISLDLKYASDVCGKIGPWMLTFGLGGMWGREKVTYLDASSTFLLKDQDLDRWGAAFYGYIPIIPEKKGNKANALGLTWNTFAGQGMGSQLPGSPYTPYDETTKSYSAAGFGTTGFAAANMNPKYPLSTGAWVQATYYFNNQWFTNVLWGYQTNNWSEAMATAAYFSANAYACGQIKNIQNFIVNIMYDPSPAVRLGLEYTRITTGYLAARYSQSVASEGSRSGKLDAVRFGAYYFF